MIVVLLAIFLTIFQTVALISRLHKLEIEREEELRNDEKQQREETREKLRKITEESIRKRRIYSVFSACGIWISIWATAFVYIFSERGKGLIIPWYIMIASALIYAYYADIKATFRKDSGSEE